jgi:hypothetical protein
MGGRFHPVRDLARLVDEMVSAQASAGLALTLRGDGSGEAISARGAMSDRLGALVCRGVLPWRMFEVDCAGGGLRVSSELLGDVQFGSSRAHELSPAARDAVDRVLELEDEIRERVAAGLGGEVNPAALSALVAQLTRLRARWRAALDATTVGVRPARGMLATFLGETLAAVRVHLEALERLISQYLRPQGEADLRERQQAHAPLELAPALFTHLHTLPALLRRRTTSSRRATVRRCSWGCSRCSCSWARVSTRSGSKNACSSSSPSTGCARSRCCRCERSQPHDATM